MSALRSLASAAGQLQGGIGPHSRGVLKIAGSGLWPFLQKLVSNDVHEVERSGRPLVYANLLSAQGRFLHDLFLQRTNDAEPTVLADVDAHFKGTLMQELEKYCLHHQVSIQDVSDSHSVWVRFGDQEETSEPSTSGVSWCRDPRLPALGQRAIVEASMDGGSVWRAYRRWRALHGVAEGDSEIPSGEEAARHCCEAIPLEYNLDALHAISYTKGCYGIVRKRLMPFRLEGGAGGSAEAGLQGDGGGGAPVPGRRAAPPVLDVYNAEGTLMSVGNLRMLEGDLGLAQGTLMSVGNLRMLEGDLGLALVRLESALPAIAEGAPLYLMGVGPQAVPINFFLPTWWPKSFVEQAERDMEQQSGSRLSPSVRALIEAQTLSLSEVRSVLRLQGDGLWPFLQGLVTNDVAALERAGAQPLYAAILNAQGRHLHDMLIHRVPGEQRAALLDVDAQGKDDLLRLLKRYRLRLKIAIDDLSDSHSVWVRFGGSGEAAGRSGGAAGGGGGAASSSGEGGWPTDPRLPALGLRAVVPNEQAPSSSGGGGWQDFRRWRVLHGVAEGDSEIPTGEVIPLEFNLDGLHGISFTKGCYVGQELMARTHFKGVVRKRLMPFQLLAPGGGAGMQPGQRVLRPGGGAVGVVRVAAGDVGLAVLRLGKVLPAVEAGQPLAIEAGSEGSVEVRAWRPNWWPPQWGREEQQDAAGGDG
eukprot:scaffold1.g5774.t1